MQLVDGTAELTSGGAPWGRPRDIVDFRTEAGVPSIVLLNAVRDEGVDGIDDYSRMLAHALNEAGASCALLTRRPTVPHTHRQTLMTEVQAMAAVEDADAIVVQYNPFSWGRWGFAPWLVTAIGRLRGARPRPLIALMIHERFTPWGDWRQSAMSGWQRAQLMGLSTLVDCTMVSTEPWADDDAWWRQRGATLLPVGSNLPDRRDERDASRRELGVRGSEIVLTTFNTSHPSYSVQHVQAAVRAVSGIRPVVLLNLGATPRPVPGIPAGVRVVTPGPLAASALARQMSAGDIHLAPFVDGVSTRRGTLVSALQHAAPVVGTSGQNTGEILRELDLSPAEDVEAFSANAAQLASAADLISWRELSRALYERHFTWPRISGSLLERIHTSARAPGTLESPSLRSVR